MYRPWPIVRVASSGIIFFVAFSSFAAQEESPSQEPAKFIGRIGASLGGEYTTNLYQNASALNDTLGLAKLNLDGNWLPTSDLSLKLSYSGDGQLDRTVSNEGHWGHLANVSIGYRILDELFSTLSGGAEQAIYPAKLSSQYSFWGAYGRASARWEAGESSTLKLDYRFRQDQFPKYDLDNRTHLATIEFDQSVGDTVNIHIPVSFESIYYLERFLAEKDGTLSKKHRTGTRWLLEPTVIIMPSYSLRISGTLTGERNDSNDTYYYPGPFGLTETDINPSLIAHYDSYWAGSTFWNVRWDIADPITCSARIGVGLRNYDKRPAYDVNGLDTGSKEQDIWIEPSLEGLWHITDFIGLRVNYLYLKQWSNDALWDFDVHRIELFLETWWGN